MQTISEKGGSPARMRTPTKAASRGGGGTDQQESGTDVDKIFAADYLNVCFPSQKMGLWRRRYVVLRGRMLLLFRASNETQPVTAFDITGSTCCAIELDDLVSGSVFEVSFYNQRGKDPEPRVLFCAEESESLDKWLEMWECAKCYIVDAASQKNWKLVAALVDSGYSVQTKSKFNGRNTLHYAAGYGDLSTVQLLVNKGADVNGMDMAGMTPLHWAGRKGQTEVARFLIDSGGDLMARVKKGVMSGKMPLDLAREARKAECADYILSCMTSMSSWPHSDVMEFLLSERGVVGAKFAISPSDANERNLAQVISSLLVPFYARDSDNRFVVANNSMLKLLGRPLELVVGRTPGDFMVSGMVKGGDQEAIKTGKEELVVDATGGVHVAEAKRSVLKAATGKQMTVALLRLRKECFSCGCEFNFTTHRHRCHNCFRCFCAKCSPNRIAVPEMGYPNPVRVCIECYLTLSGKDTGSQAADEKTTPTVSGTPVRASGAHLVFSHDDTTGVSLEDFIMQGVVGKGGFGKVIRVVEKRTLMVFALKTLQKQKLVKMKQVEHALEEKRIMSRVRHPFIINMWYVFQTDSKVYMVLDYAPGGDLFYLLQRQSKCRFSEEDARFAAAEICLALEHLHGLGIVHRDLKPENILIDLQGHLRLADFGLSRSEVGYDSGHRHSMVGTPDYMAPEILLNSGHGCSVDWWSFGILIYEMLVGEPPFMGHNAKNTYENIKSAKTPYFPSYMSVEARDLTSRLLQRNPALRPGSGHRGSDEIRMHPFFRAIPWDALLLRQVPSPFLKTISCDALDGEVVARPHNKPHVDSICAPFDDGSSVWDGFNDWNS